MQYSISQAAAGAWLMFTQAVQWHCPAQVIIFRLACSWNHSQKLNWQFLSRKEHVARRTRRGIKWTISLAQGTLILRVAEAFAKEVLTSNQIRRNKNHNSSVIDRKRERGGSSCLFTPHQSTTCLLFLARDSVDQDSLLFISLHLYNHWVSAFLRPPVLSFLGTFVIPDQMHERKIQRQTRDRDTRSIPPLPSFMG